MSHKIFLSHNRSDKPVVEPVAERLAGIFGRDQVFYDSWSIRPGDGIIDQMNKGLEAPEFVFFFVSANSLNSGMVKLEWQNALYAASKGRTRIVPVRVDGTAMPPVLMQSLYIDMHTKGLEAAIAQIVSVTQGNASWSSQHKGFSNLSFSATTGANGTIEIVIRASHLMEPNPSFVLLVGNPEPDIELAMPNSSMFAGGFNAGVSLNNGSVHNAMLVRPLGLTLTPTFPLRIQMKQKGNAKIDFRGIMHQVGEDDWSALPRH